MAEEKKDDRIPMTSVNSTQSWVEAFYGDDAQDLKKVNKLKHIKHTAQFASFCYVISKNTKTAHTDFFKDNYTTVDKMYARAAELILKLLYIRFDKERELTESDFDECGGADLFDKAHNPEYAEICHDYLKEGGMVDMCQTLIPISEFNEKTAGVVKEITDDLDNVKKDHTFLLSVCDPKGEKGTLTRDQIFSLFHAASECAGKSWRRYKKAKPTAEGDLQKDVEDAFYLRYDLAKKSGKVAMLGGATVASLGAIISGVFWPAVILIPVYTLSKQWVPDWFKSAGAMWGNFEKRFKDKRNIDRAAAFQKWVVSYAENNGKPKLTLKERFLISGADEAFLKKLAKQVNEGVSVEGTSGKLNKSQMEIALDALSGSKAFGTLLNATATDNLVPADIYPILSARVSGLKPGSVQFKDFIEIAETFNSIESKLSTDSKTAIIYAYAEKLNESAKKLIFGTPFKSTDYYLVIQSYFKPESVIMKMLEKSNRPDIVGTINKLLVLGSKELTGFGKEHIGMNLEQFIQRDVPERIKPGSSEELALDYAAATGKYKEALDLIFELKLADGDPRKFVTFSGRSLADVKNTISEITNPTERNKCNDLLKSQMDTLIYSKDRSDSKLVYSLATADAGYGLGGKIPLADIFDKFKDINYENAHSFAEDINIGKIKPQKAQDYVKGKLSKAVFDIMKKQCDQNTPLFQTDLAALAEFIKKVNNNPYLNDKQKMDLTAMASPYVQTAFDKKYDNLTRTFLSQYKVSEFETYLQGYENGGFRELFESDLSPETQRLKNNILHLEDMKKVYDVLQLNGYNFNPEDAKYVARSLLLDRETGKPIIRESTDSLRIFISSMNEVGIDFGGTIIIPPPSEGETPPEPKEKIPTLAPYVKLNNSLGELTKELPTIDADAGVIKDATGAELDPSVFDSLDDDRKKRLHDAYTSLIILRNKAIAVFRQFMKTLVNEGSAGHTSVQQWAGTTDGGRIIREYKDAWSPLLNGIDKAISDFEAIFAGKINIQGASINKAADQLGLYSSAADVANIVTKNDILVEKS